MWLGGLRWSLTTRVFFGTKKLVHYHLYYLNLLKTLLLLLFSRDGILLAEMQPRATPQPLHFPFYSYFLFNLQNY